MAGCSKQVWICGGGSEAGGLPASQPEPSASSTSPHVTALTLVRISVRIVSGKGVNLVAEDGRSYLDAGVSSALVGHGHPRVVEALATQATRLSSKVALSHPGLEELTARLREMAPAGLTRCYLLNSLSEATELALRIARANTRGKDVVVLEDAWFGVTTTLTNMSPVWRQPAGSGKGIAPRHWIRVAPRRQPKAVCAVIEEMVSSGRGLCAVFADGFPVAGHWKTVYEKAHDAGGLTLSIEAGIGLGRPGPDFWGCSAAGLAPDLAVIGEELSNGSSIAAVFAKPARADAFEERFQALSEQGLLELLIPPADPLSCAAALATLGVIQEEGLAERARHSGDCLQSALPADQTRGAGMSWEIDVPDALGALTQLRELGILAVARGNTVLVRPPLTFKDEELEQLCGGLHQTLRQPR